MPALTNLAAAHVSAGELRRAFALQHEAAGLAERFADAMTIHWLTAERVLEDYWNGRWDDALALAAELLAARNGAYIDGMLRIVQARIALARGDGDSALDDSERALRAARAAGDSQFLLPALALRARVLLETGRAGAAELAEELLAAARGDAVEFGSYWADLAATLLGLGREAELFEAAAGVRTSTRWVDAAGAVASGAFERAAEIYREIGSQPDEAWARSRAAVRLRDG